MTIRLLCAVLSIRSFRPRRSRARHEHIFFVNPFPMIRAMIFDLDGTLVQTEKLKAFSYARAAVELRPGAFTEDDVNEAFKEVVGLDRRSVAVALMKRFDLEDAARARMQEFGVVVPWQAYVQIRLRIYTAMLADPDEIRNHQWPCAIELLHEARRTLCRTGLATMSYCPQVQRILEALDLAQAFDFIATRDDVEQGKPSPEIYLLVAKELEVSPEDCLVIEDSPTGVCAAQAAGMNVIAVSTPYTHDRLVSEQLLPATRIVDDPRLVQEAVARVLAENR